MRCYSFITNYCFLLKNCTCDPTQIAHKICKPLHSILYKKFSLLIMTKSLHYEVFKMHVGSKKRPQPFPRFRAERCIVYDSHNTTVNTYFTIFCVLFTLFFPLSQILVFQPIVLWQLRHKNAISIQNIWSETYLYIICRKNHNNILMMPKIKLQIN